MQARRRASFAVLAALLLVPVTAAIAQLKGAQSKDVVILAAASLKNALDEASAAWTKDTGKAIKISYAASSALAWRNTPLVGKRRLSRVSNVSVGRRLDVYPSLKRFASGRR